MTTNSYKRPPMEVRKAIGHRDNTLFLRAAGMPLQPGREALILIGDEQQRRWEKGEPLLKEGESNIIKAYFLNRELPLWAGAFVEIISENVVRWKNKQSPLSIDEQREILKRHIGEEQMDELLVP